MTGPESFYRREALEHHRKPPGPGQVLRIVPRWTRWLYWVTLVLLIAAVGTACVVRVSRSVQGAAVIDPRNATFTALIPAANPAAIRPGRIVLLQITSTSSQHLAGWARRTEVATTAAARRAGFGPVTGPAVLVTGRLRGGPLSAQVPVDAVAVVAVGSERVADVFASGIGQLFSNGGGQ